MNRQYNPTKKRYDPTTSSKVDWGQFRPEQPLAGPDQSHEENVSMAFSLTALAARAKKAQAAVEHEDATSNDDSGMIDLNALMAAQGAVAVAKSAGIPRVPVFPLGDPTQRGSEHAVAAHTPTTLTHHGGPVHRRVGLSSWLTTSIVAVAAALVVTAVAAAPSVIQLREQSTEAPEVAHIAPLQLSPLIVPMEATAEVQRGKSTRPVIHAPARVWRQAKPSPASPSARPSYFPEPRPAADPCQGNLLCAIKNAAKEGR